MKVLTRLAWILFFPFVAFAQTGGGEFEEMSPAQDVQPYIESIKEKNKLVPRGVWPPATMPQGALPSQEQVVESDPNVIQPNLEQMKEHYAPQEAELISEGERAPEPTPTDENVQPHIDALKSGLKLRPQYKKKVDRAVGLAAIASATPDFSSDKAQANEFSKVYNTKGYNFGFDFFYEYQLLRNNYGGAVGANIHIGALLFNGHGFFSSRGQKTDQVKFRFLAVPVTAAVGYRFVLIRMLQPFIQGGFTGTPYFEMRDDQQATKRGVSTALSTVGGLALNLDWISRRDSWDRYDTAGILHTYLVAQVQRIQHLVGHAKMNYTGIYAGLMFEM